MKKTGILVKPLKKRKASDLEMTASISNPGTSIPAPTSAASTSINLGDWIGSQILARKEDGFYYPGIIKSILAESSIQILLDSDSSTTRNYPNVLETNDILTNCSAPAIMVKIGVLVCVKAKPSDSHFTVGRVRKIRPGPPMQCLVQIENECVWISRAWIRLLQPPWFDDLEDTGGQEVSLGTV